jgi:hypothetical protein
MSSHDLDRLADDGCPIFEHEVPNDGAPEGVADHLVAFKRFYLAEPTAIA